MTETSGGGLDAEGGPTPAEAGSGGPFEPSHVGHARRIKSLDGLRGLAALIVLFNHVVIAGVPSLSLQDSFPNTRLPVGSVSWWLAFTPLHILFDGSQAVLIFFVLSGFVLALPAVKLDWRWFDASYYPRRLLRLYLPVWGALVIAVLLEEAVTHRFVRGAPFWLNLHAVPMTLSSGLKAASLASQGGQMAFISPLWSLHWEVLFSLLLPPFLAFPILTRNRRGMALAGAGGCLLLIAAGIHYGNAWLQYLPVFITGSIMAFHQESLETIALWMRRHLGRRFFSIGLPAIAVVLLTSDNWPFALHSRHVRLITSISGASVTAGACLAIFLALYLPQFARALSSRPGNWLGVRSYSLYLVHSPLLIALAFAMGGRVNFALFALIAIPSSIILATGFWRVVERPAVSVARWAGKRTMLFLPARLSPRSA